MMDVCEKSLKITDFEISEIERSTRGQHVSSEWFKQRMYRLIASNFYSACLNKVEPSNKLKNMFYTHFENASTQHGMFYEKHAVQKYEQYLKNCNISALISDTGLIVSKSLPYLGASLDGLVTEENTGDQWLVEIKCPYSMHSRTLGEALESKTFFLCQSGGKVCLKKNHRYFYQIQGQMFCSNLNKADFVVWFSDTEPIYVETIFFDVSFWNEKMFPGLSFFYRRAINKIKIPCEGALM